MRRIDFNLPIFDWNITIVTLYNKEDSGPLKQLLESINADPKGMEEELRGISLGAKDGGDTWRDPKHRRIVIVIFPWRTESKFYEVINHEKRHMIDRIIEHHKIKDIETPAYIDGYLSSIIYSRINELK